MAGGSREEHGVLVIGGEEYVVLRRDLYERQTRERAEAAGDRVAVERGELERLRAIAEEHVVLRRNLHERQTADRAAAAGDKVAVERGELERLRLIAEDHADLIADARFRARLAAGEEELVPAAMVERLLNGENPVRVWREHRGLTATALAAAARVSAAYLSEIERGVKPGSVAAMKRLAEALRVAVDDLV